MNSKLVSGIIFSGFQAYLGMLTIDEYHNHPVLKAFVELLQKEVQKAKEKTSNQNNGKLPHEDKDMEMKEIDMSMNGDIGKEKGNLNMHQCK